MRFFRVTLIALIAALLLTCGVGIGEGLHEELANPNLTLDVTVGYDGLMTYGKVMPIRVRIENSGADLNGVVAVNTYENKTQYNRYEMDLDLAQGAVKEIMLPVRVGSQQETYTVELWQGGEKLCAVNAAPTQLINPASMLTGVLSPEPQNLSYMNITMETDDLMRGEYNQIVSLTEQTFPEDAEALNSFSTIVVDGFDVGALSDRQIEALQTWLEAGHILIVGGGPQASATWPYFSARTGILPGEIAQHADVTPALLSWIEVQSEPLGQEMTLAAATGGSVLIADGETPLIWRTSAGAGVIYTAAFELGNRALAAWKPMHSFWQRLMIEDCYSLYQKGYISGGDYDDIAYNISQIPMKNDADLPGTALALAALLIAGGALAYLLLKRMDRRQLMWLVLPMLAAAGTVLVCLATSNGAAARPTALSISVLSQDEVGSRELSTTLGIAAPDRGQRLVSVSEGALTPNDYMSYGSYSYYDEKEEPSEPTELNYRFVLGEGGGIGLDFDAPWRTKYFQVGDLTPPEGEVETSLWMEEDGLHGYIINGTEMRLSEGVFVCRYGYCSVPAMEPGERCELELRRATFADPNRQVYEDGCMYESLANGYVDVYSMLNEYYFHASQPDADYSDPEKQLRMNLMSRIIEQQYRDDSYNYSYYTPKFHYVAFTDALEGAPVQLDRAPVERKASRGIACVAMNYNPAGVAGRIYRIPGMDAAVRCQVDASGAPYYNPDAVPITGEYHRLSDCPTFVFEVEGAADATIERMAICSQSMPASAHMFLYDGESWVECAPGTDVASPERFVDDEGRVYVQFRCAGADEYYEIYTPSLLLEGRVQ